MHWVVFTPTPVEEDGIQLPIVAVNLITSNIPVSSTEIELICEETSKDPTLTLLRHYIHMGWPIDHRMLPQELHTFWNYREDLSMENRLITKGARLLIPSTLRRKVLEQIHDGHLGIEKCMLKARDSVFWPGISNDIRETVEKCGICQASSRAAKPVGNVSDVPPYIWHTLGTDLFYWNKIDYLVIGDYFSKYHIEKDQVRIKPRSQPSHFELQAEAQQGNFEGKTYTHSSDSFNQLNGHSMLPVSPMASVTKPATVDRGSKVSEITDPISSTETPQPTVRGAITSLPSISFSLPSTPRCSTKSTKGVPPVRFTPSKKWMDYSGCFICAGYAVLGLIVLVSPVRTSETWNYVEYSSPLVYSEFLL